MNDTTYFLRKDCMSDSEDEQITALQNSLAIATMDSAEKDALIRNLSRSLQAWAMEAFRYEALLEAEVARRETAEAEVRQLTKALQRVANV